MFVTANASMTAAPLNVPQPGGVIRPYFTVTTTLADVLHTHLIIDANTHQTSET